MKVLNSKNSRLPAHLQYRLKLIAACPMKTAVALFSVVTLAGAGVVGCATTAGSSNKAEGQFSISQTPVEVPVFKGLLWFPFSWTAQLSTAENDPAGKPVSGIQFRNVGLVLRDAQTKQEVFLKLSSIGGDGSSNAALDSTAISKTFFLPLFVELSESEYQIESVRCSFVDPNTQRPQQLDFPLANPFQASGKPALSISVKKGKVAALARVVSQTTFGQKAGALNSSTDLESFDKDSVPVDVVLDQMHRDAKSAALVFPASSDFPRSRLALTDPEGKPVPFEEPLARAGLLLDVPCAAEGTLKLVWRRVGDEREYFSLVNLGQKISGCQSQKTLSPTLNLPKGDWVLRATQISTRAAATSAANGRANQAEDAKMQVGLQF